MPRDTAGGGAAFVLVRARSSLSSSAPSASPPRAHTSTAPLPTRNTFDALALDTNSSDTAPTKTNPKTKKQKESKGTKNSTPSTPRLAADDGYAVESVPAAASRPAEHGGNAAELAPATLSVPSAASALCAADEPPAAQTAIDLNGLAQGLVYRASGPGLIATDLANLSTATPGTDRTVVSDQPAGVQAYVSAHSDATAEPGERLVAVLGSLVDNGYVSHGGVGEAPSRSGHSAERITSLLTDKLMIGDEEQYSVAAALLAQQVGFPARVVVGFVVPEGATEVTGSDLRAWVEVNTSTGWLAIDPVPDVRPIPDTPPDDPNRVSPPQSVVDPPPADVSQIRGAQAPQSDEKADTQEPDPVWLILRAILEVVVWLAVVAAVILLPPVAIVAAKASRRRRRLTAPDARKRVLGARDQVADVLTDARLAVTPATTNRELASRVSVRDAPALAFVIDRAEYSADALVASDARTAWLVVEDIENELMTGLTRRQRLMRRLAVWSLVRRHRSV